MGFALTNGRVLLDDGFRTDKAVIIEGESISAIVDAGDIPSGLERRDLDNALLLPGFIDTQVNGGGGVLFNDVPTPDGIAAIGRAHRRFGTTGFMPTLISDDLDQVARSIAAVDAAIAAKSPGVLGVHIEGPFLNVERKGIHAADHIRRADAEGLAVLKRPGRGVRMVTLAPEMVAAEGIKDLARAGLLVCAGHTNATYAIMTEALEQGLRGFTHLFNAMSPLGSREPGTVGAALADDRSWCGIIVDGAHVAPVVLQLALRCSRMERFMLVTDAMPTVGAETKSFELQGKTINVLNGVCVDDKGTLAGSDLDMAAAVRNSVEMLDIDLADAVRMASRNPAEFLGLGDELGRIAPGYRASLAAADDDLQVIETWIDGADGRAEARHA
ncbi:N-acetylglucosamine-6-phosphate deacetylase [Sphingosinicella sp. BN140058]|uniref:N-acetylglucosamine-6-phosphate deacetylase n=1 Tax=Sphingosinicella sp. BN140058 TaxID=1892855 RepID=UPI0010105A6B|nr:N-acetylglucosamine-6-phosphate deacetylase [Sphingosinicella sp. BN140058]QAY75551.1 N-acetylglucosamine-6-phosphate deacetylase [Sphingosinicella sp. BN140058]